MNAQDVAGVRLAELVASLSAATDLARGQRDGQALRAATLATRLADRAGLRAADLSHVYWATLLRYVGCTATSHDFAQGLGGDDIAVRAAGDRIDATNERDLLEFLTKLGMFGGPLHKAADVARAFMRVRRVATEATKADCEVASLMAERLGMPDPVRVAVTQLFERWDGHGGPSGLQGEAIAAPARYAGVAFTALMFADTGGADSATAAVQSWAGKLLDPEICAQFLSQADDQLGAIAAEDPWRAALEAEPRPHRVIREPEVDDVIEAFGDLIDLKTPYLFGHSAHVAELCEEAARRLALSRADATLVRRAARLHDLGRVAVPTGILEKPPPLTTAEREQAELHPYHSERILARSTLLAPLARVAGAHHERLDGSGYHRGTKAASQDTCMRILAAADALAELMEDRPGRTALPVAKAASTLRSQPLDAEAVAAVLAAAGAEPSPAAAQSPCGLTSREVEILRLAARGLKMKEIAAELVISTATVHTHIAHIHKKTGISTRAGLAMFAMEHDLLRGSGSSPRS